MKRTIMSALLVILLSVVNTYAGGVTNVKEVVNNTSGVIKLLKRDFTKHIHHSYRKHRRDCRGGDLERRYVDSVGQ